MSRSSKYFGVNDEIDVINSEMTKLLNKEKMNISSSDQDVCNIENWKENMDDLIEELGLLGINLNKPSGKEADNIVSLCNAMWPVVHRYKKLYEKWSNCDLGIRRIQQDNEYLIKSNKTLKSSIEEKEHQIKSLKSTRLKLKTDLELATKEISQLKSQLEKQRKQQISKDVQRQKEAKRSEVQMNNLQDKFRGQCGQYTSRDKSESKQILEFKKNEAKYKQVIEHLEENQNKLLHEILDLKEELVLMRFEKNLKQGKIDNTDN